MSSAQPSFLVNFSPFSVAKAVWDHKILCLAIWTLLTAAIVYVVHRLPTVYRAEAAVLVESQRIPEKYVSSTVTPDLQDRLNTLSSQILSYTRLMGMIQKYDLYQKERKHMVQEEIVALMRSDITIKQEHVSLGRPGGTFRVSYQGSNPTMVAQVANQIASFFVDENLRQREVEAVGTSEFLDNQLAEAKKRLEEQETMLSRYKLQYNGELPQQENALLTASGQAKVQLMGVQDALNRAQQNKTILEASLANAQATEASLLEALDTTAAETRSRNTSAVPAVSPAPAAAPTPTESERLEAQLAALRARYSEEHPDVRRLKAELERVRQTEKAAAAPKPAPGGPAVARLQPVPAPSTTPRISALATQNLTASHERVATLKAQIANANKEIEGLTRDRQNILRELSSIQARVEKLPVREQQLAAVTRDYQTTASAYQSLLDKKLSADVAADMEKRQKAERFVMLEQARPPEKPVKPKREILDAAGCLFALALGIASAVGLEFRKGVLMGEWEFTSAVTVLGRIPVIELPPVSVSADRGTA